ncbi:MAG: prepilin-type N-terminal cleavage/methylation domain-containing protein [Candidatus Vogelbacteria bacterium]|nr:prepilin-type N-terminal cleavage/methylation domain-containing protein [Candidatus Vogelbacteria bacterium]
MKLKLKSHKLKAAPGFTLIESLVAITVLLIGVLGPMTAATRGITDGLYAGNQLVGTYLAQEGLELLSARIDQNNKGDSLDHDGDGDQDIDDLLSSLGACKYPSFCAVVFASATNLADVTFEACADASNCEIAYHETDGFYKPYDGGGGFIGPVFTRTLTVQTLTADEVLLKSEVRWRNRATDPADKIVNLFRYAFHDK